MKRLSIIIVTYKSEADIYDCLASIDQYADLPREEIEVIVVDNSPECDPMFSRLRELYADDIILIHNTHNGGYGQGNNVGIRRATAPVIMVMNPDVRLMEPVLKTAVAAFDDDSRLCMYGMTQMLSPTVRSTGSFIPNDRVNGYVMPLLNGFCCRRNWYLPRLMLLSGSCFFVRKEMFEAVGLFDETNFMYGEEADIHYRLGQKFGYRMKYNKHLHYIHLTMERELTLDYLKRKLEADCRVNEKNGYPRRKTIRHQRQSCRLWLLREWLRVKLGHRSRVHYNILKDFYSYAGEQLKEARKDKTSE